MELIDAWWEKRNLGVTCTEVLVGPADSAEEVLAAVDLLRSQYQVIKIPVARPDLTMALSERGFYFIECLLSVAHDLRLPEVPAILQRMIEATECRELDRAEITDLGHRLNRGLFETDRVNLDPRFSAEQAAHRYTNWIDDEVRAGAEVHETSLRGKPNGFFLFREGPDRTGISVLSGLYDKEQSPGMGGVLLYLIVAEAARRELARITSHISSNNVAVVKTHIMLGFTITDLHYVFVRHLPGESTR